MKIELLLFGARSLPVWQRSDCATLSQSDGERARVRGSFDFRVTARSMFRMIAEPVMHLPSASPHRSSQLNRAKPNQAQPNMFPLYPSRRAHAYKPNTADSGTEHRTLKTDYFPAPVVPWSASLWPIVSASPSDSQRVLASRGGEGVGYPFLPIREIGEIRGPA